VAAGGETARLEAELAKVKRESERHRRKAAQLATERRVAAGCDSFGVFVTIFRELEWKTPIFSWRVVPETPKRIVAGRTANSGGAPGPLRPLAALRFLPGGEWGVFLC
jgi:hypothetical protein